MCNGISIAPEYLSNLLTKCSETNVRSLRSRKQETLKVSFARTTYYGNHFQSPVQNTDILFRSHLKRMSNLSI